MLKPIKDCEKHTVCFVDAETGLLESGYKKHKVKTIVPVGGACTIFRDGTKTEIIRVSVKEFKVYSYLAVA